MFTFFLFLMFLVVFCSCKSDIRSCGQEMMILYERRKRRVGGKARKKKRGL